MIDKINFEDKTSLNIDPSILEINKLTADNVNEIKRVVNSLIETGIENKIKERNEHRYHIGALIFDTTNTNPSTYLGFGTWELWGSGRVPVGVDNSNELFNSSEKIGGQLENTIRVENLPSHSHSVGEHSHEIPAHKHSIGEHYHSFSGNVSTEGNHYHGVGWDKDGGGGSNRYTVHDGGTSGSQGSAPTSYGGSHSHSYSGTTSTKPAMNTTEWSGSTENSSLFNTGNTGNGESISVVQSYITCYIFKRVS